VEIEVNNLETSQYNSSYALTDKVYMCGGAFATKFHSRTNCRGLNNCRSDIYYYNSQNEAKENEYDYCSLCWRLY